jgi:hypothetical protein
MPLVLAQASAEQSRLRGGAVEDPLRVAALDGHPFAGRGRMSGGDQMELQVVSKHLSTSSSCSARVDREWVGDR